MSDEMNEQDDAVLAASAHAILVEGGCQAIRIEGAGDNWHVWCGYRPGDFFVSAFSAKNPATPNDPVYLARQALATLQRNEGPPPDSAAALEPVAEIAEATEGLAHETHSETGEAASESPVHDTGQEEPGRSGVDDPAAQVDEFGGASDANSVDDPIDADFEPFAEQEPELGEGDDLGLGAIEDYSVEEAPQAEPPPLGGQDRFIGLDDLDRRRSLRIGGVVRISLEKQEAIWANAGTTETEYRDLLGQVMHDTVNGSYKGPSAIFARFNELQKFANAATSVQSAERAKVAFLKDAGREEVERFDPEADWP